MLCSVVGWWGKASLPSWVRGDDGGPSRSVVVVVHRPGDDV
jgi:hypothetical protein